ncbi:MAG: RNA-metabolising metallo-beta-lactamase [Clostridiales bacterium 38_11]|nr:MAG: RNA-metabolising metallo-beta-lactamase [Clostridiales bacterium 38_11]HBH13247.1 MBL fold hydrolase [Clostridiales bacterium]
MKLKFTGGAGGILTGSCHYIEYAGRKMLLDCGLFQGRSETEKLNENEFPFNPAEIDYLLLSHAHIDHSGRIPLLVKKGFKGKIFASNPTYDLCTIMLMDSAHIQETEAQWKTEKALRKGEEPILPLYTTEDAQNSLSFFKPVLYEQYEEIDENLTVRFVDAGHILGSSIIEMWFKENGNTTKVVFSGDLGMKNKPIIRDPEIIEKADYLIIESTYGDRLHDSSDERVEKLANTILKTIRNKGTVVIPSFAVGRTQEIIYELNEHYDGESEFKQEFDKINVYIDSPLASKATEIFKKNAHVFDETSRDKIMSGDNPLEFKNLHFTQTVDESKALNISTEPKVIISASGMCNAGRIRHHLKHNLWRKNATVIFVGYMAEGTLGRLLKDGLKEVKLFGEEIVVNADIVSIDGFSGHADQNGLLEWLSGFKEGPKKVFIIHGEETSKQTFSKKIKERFNYETIIPLMNSEYLIENNDAVMISEGIKPIDVKEKMPVIVKTETIRKETIDKEDVAKISQVLLMKKEELITETAERDDDETAGADKIKKLQNELELLKELSVKIFEMTTGLLEKTDIKIGEYKQLNNHIKELEKSLVNLSIISGK